jgi:hypothetical protein
MPSRPDQKCWSGLSSVVFEGSSTPPKPPNEPFWSTLQRRCSLTRSRIRIAAAVPSASAPQPGVNPPTSGPSSWGTKVRVDRACSLLLPSGPDRKCRSGFSICKTTEAETPPRPLHSIETSWGGWIAKTPRRAGSGTQFLARVVTAFEVHSSHAPGYGETVNESALRPELSPHKVPFGRQRLRFGGIRSVVPTQPVGVLASWRSSRGDFGNTFTHGETGRSLPNAPAFALRGRPGTLARRCGSRRGARRKFGRGSARAPTRQARRTAPPYCGETASPEVGCRAR